MTNEDLKLLIDKANNNDELIHLRPLSETVYFAKFWLEKPCATDNIIYNDRFHKSYFIKNTDRLFVAIVYVMGEQDLHVYVLEEHRKQGYLTKAMKEVILFHLFKSREEQQITIQKKRMPEKDYEASKKVALSLGFKLLKNETYSLSKEEYQVDDLVFEKNMGITLERINELQKQINYLSKSLSMIQIEIEMKLGKTEYTDELEELVEEIFNHTWKLEDFYDTIP